MSDKIIPEPCELEAARIVCDGDFDAHYCGRIIAEKTRAADADGVLRTAEWWKRDRDEWRDSTIMANERFKAAEARLAQVEQENAGLRAANSDWKKLATHLNSRGGLGFDMHKVIETMIEQSSSTSFAKHDAAVIEQAIKIILGWRESDWPEGFCRFTAATLAQWLVSQLRTLASQREAQEAKHP